MTGRRVDIDQHIGWLRQLIQGMTPENWRDMQLRADRQLDQLERALSEEPKR